MHARFHTRPGYAVGLRMPLDDVAAHHAVRVLRLGVGDPLELFDGEGNAADAVLESTRPAIARIERLLPAQLPSPVRLTLAQCLSSADKMDWTLEKAVELGAVALVPLQSARSIVRLDPDRAARRDAHWRRLIIASCGQCRRNRLPDLAAVSPLAQWLRGLPPCPPHELRLILDPQAPDSLVARVGVGPAPDAVVLLCGPESGFSDDERALAIGTGWQPAGLGPRVLRTETAGPAALALMQGLIGDFR